MESGERMASVGGFPCVSCHSLHQKGLLYLFLVFALVNPYILFKVSNSDRTLCNHSVFPLFSSPVGKSQWQHRQIFLSLWSVGMVEWRLFHSRGTLWTPPRAASSPPLVHFPSCCCGMLAKVGLSHLPFRTHSVGKKKRIGSPHLLLVISVFF